MPNFPQNPYLNQVVSWQGYEYQWNGEQWVNLAFPNPAIVPVYVSASPPQPPIIPGSLWFNTLTLELSIWVAQSGTYVWETTQAGQTEQPFVYVSASAPTDPINGTLWYQPAQQILRIWVVSGVSENWVVLVDNAPPEAEPSTVLVSTSPPLDPSQGLLWFNPNNNLLKVWIVSLSGATWRTISGESPSSKPTVYVSTSPPPNPAQGDLWWQPLSQELRVWNVSLTGSAWVLITDNTPQAQVPPVYISIDEPVNPKLRYLWFDPQTSELKVWNGVEWDLVSTSATPVPPPVKVSASPPVATEEGQLWFDPITGILSVWYTDLDGGQWLATVPYSLIEAAEQAAQSAALAEQYAEQAASYFQEVLIDSSQTGIIYVGKAPIGSSQSSPVWFITKSTFSLAGALLSEQTAENVAWTNRYTVPYS